MPAEEAAELDDIETYEAALAATLVLSNYALLTADASLAVFHLQAARVLIKTLTVKTSDALFTFLQNQVAGLDVLACTTLFNAEYIRGAVLPDLHRVPVVFGAYLHIIHDINCRSIEEPRGTMSFVDLEDKMELARGASLMAAAKFAGSKEAYQRDITRLVQCFHHAGLIYACKRGVIAEAALIEQNHIPRIFRLLQQFEDLNSCMGNLTWPLFIAGICASDEEQVDSVRLLCRRLSEGSPFKYYANIRTFLDELWASEHRDWTVIAQKWEAKSMPILAV